MPELIYKLVPVHVAQFAGSGIVITTKAPPGDKKRRIRLVITATRVDRDKEVILASGAEVEPFLENPVVLFSHGQQGMLPVANATELVLREEEIEAEIEFFTPDENPLAEQLRLLYQRGKMRAVSIGFLPIEVTEEKIIEGQEGRAFLRWELLEFSLVAIPSLREALTIDERSLEIAHQKALGPSWRPSSSRADVRAELAATLWRIRAAVDDMGYDKAIAACDMGLAALKMEELEEKLARVGGR